jgi:hypothetical protein
MPTATYEDLLVETAPARISDARQYDAVRARFGDLLGRAKRTRAEDKLMDLLGVLIMDYDRRNSMPPDDSTPALFPVQPRRQHAGQLRKGCLQLIPQTFPIELPCLRDIVTSERRGKASGHPLIKQDAHRWHWRRQQEQAAACRGSAPQMQARPESAPASHLTVR